MSFKRKIKLLMFSGDMKNKENSKGSITNYKNEHESSKLLNLRPTYKYQLEKLIEKGF